jgi:hypothetical protein
LAAVSLRPNHKAFQDTASECSALFCWHFDGGRHV